MSPVTLLTFTLIQFWFFRRVGDERLLE
jgi:hypothetical protein